jgi:hypothetical protein
MYVSHLELTFCDGQLWGRRGCRTSEIDKPDIKSVSPKYPFGAELSSSVRGTKLGAGLPRNRSIPGGARHSLLHRPSKFAQAVSLVTYIREMLGSNLGWDTDYPGSRNSKKINLFLS